MNKNYFMYKLRSYAPDFPPPPPPPPPKSRRKLIAIVVIVLIAVLAISTVAFLFSNNPPVVTPTPSPTPFYTAPPGPTANPTTSANQYTINTGAKTTLTTQTISTSGGTIQTTDASSPMNGLRIDVPEGAATQPIQFDIGYSDISSIDGLPQNCEVAGKLISIETSGNSVFNQYKMFGKMVTVTLPYIASDDHSSVVRYYWYDGQAGKLDSMGFLTEDQAAHTLTFETASFSDFVAVRTFLNFTGSALGLDAVVDTNFRPARDGWFIPNYGSYLDYSTATTPNSTINGYCLGMVSFAKWYYSYVATGFYSKYHEGDPAVWQDDATAIQLAARAHVATTGIWNDMNNAERQNAVAYWNTADSRQVALSFIAGMIVTGEPQLMGLKTIKNDGTWAAGGHAVLVYAYGNSNFEIYDPNYPGSTPGTTVHQLPFNYSQGFSKLFTSALSASDPNGMKFNIFYHASAKLAATPNNYQGIYNSAEKGFKDDSVFPVITVTDASTTPSGTSPTDTDGDGIRDTTESTATISGTITNQQGNWRYDQIQIFCDNVQYTATVASGAFSLKIPLMAGVNDVVLLATDTSTFSEWGGFLRVPIKSTASPAAMTVTLTWDQDTSDVDLHVLEPSDGRHIYWDNSGSGLNYPYLDVDNTQGYGPEHYYATTAMTLPGSTSIYGNYQIRVQYYSDKSGADTPQTITWHLNIKYLAFKDTSTGKEYWTEDSYSGSLSTPSSSGTYNFNNDGPSWTGVYTVNYAAPNPSDFGISTPPQNVFKWSP